MEKRTCGSVSTFRFSSRKSKNGRAAAGGTPSAWKASKCQMTTVIWPTQMHLNGIYLPSPWVEHVQITMLSLDSCKMSQSWNGTFRTKCDHAHQLVCTSIETTRGQNAPLLCIGRPEISSWSFSASSYCKHIRNKHFTVDVCFYLWKPILSAI